MSLAGPVPRRRHPLACVRPRLALASVALLAATWLPALPGAARAESLTKSTENFLESVTTVAEKLHMSDVPGSIEVSSDSLVFDYEGGRLDYAGNVHVAHGGVRIRSNELTLEFTPDEKRELQKITARGNVRVERGDENAAGELAVYDPGAGTIVLSENARLGSGPNTLTGERVVVYLREGKATVHGSIPAADEGTGGEGVAGEAGAPVQKKDGRVRVILMPESLEGIDEEDLLGE